MGGVNASLLSTFHFPCFTPSVKSFTCNPFSSMFNLSIYSCDIFQRLMCFHYFSLLPPAPTNSPTAGPTDSPTLHFCDSGEHQCDVANGVCVEHPSGWFDVYECECNEGYGNRPPYHFSTVKNPLASCRQVPLDHLCVHELSPPFPPPSPAIPLPSRQAQMPYWMCFSIHKSRVRN